MMQLLGRQYFENETADGMTENTTDTVYDEDGMEALCEAVEESGSTHLPAWMAAAADAVRGSRRHLIVAASVLVIGFAVYLNWSMYNGGSSGVTDGTGVEGVSYSDGIAAQMPEAEDVAVEDAADDYFAVSQINRQRARDEAIAVLQDVVDGAANLSDVQSEALLQISQIAEDIENEAAIESLVKGKGFSDCVAVISGDAANVIVRSSALLPNEVAQIQEIVYETAGILPANVKIIEK
ncbi:MAG: SpoIIIAH-like family protein [Clostridia bacterium]|nr:SpoIIIAH-like family protein [Clostridia bacterium]